MTPTFFFRANPLSSVEFPFFPRSMKASAYRSIGGPLRCLQGGSTQRNQWRRFSVSAWRTETRGNPARRPAAASGWSPREASGKTPQEREAQGSGSGREPSCGHHNHHHHLDGLERSMRQRWGSAEPPVLMLRSAGGAAAPLDQRCGFKSRRVV